MKAIETEYKGHIFRSRLEARWAVFFNALGIEYLYEHQGYEAETPNGQYRYLPDFYLPEQKLHVEVKGDPDGLNKMISNGFDWFLGYDCPMPGFRGSESNRSSEYIQGGLLILGEVSDSGFGSPVHTVLTHDEKASRVRISTAIFAGCELYMFGSAASVLFGFPYGSWQAGDDAIDIPVNAGTLSGARKAYTASIDAYKQARSARFEHGQSGAIVRDRIRGHHENIRRV